MRLDEPVEAVTPRRAFEAMFTFYTEQRADDVVIDEDGDMLLYEWPSLTTLPTPPTTRARIRRFDEVEQVLPTDSSGL